MSDKKKFKKPETAADRARKLVAGRTEPDARALADALQDLLDEDPGNLNGRFMAELYLKWPSLAGVMRKYTLPQLVTVLKRELSKVTHPEVIAALGIEGQQAREMRESVERKAIDEITKAATTATVTAGKAGGRLIFRP